jgi:hypothetical protein
MVGLRKKADPASRLDEAAEIFLAVSLSSDFTEFLTQPAYKKLLEIEQYH